MERLEDFSADLVFVEVDQAVEISDETAQVVGDVGVGLRFRDYFDVGACVEVAAADLHCRQGNLQKIKTESHPMLRAVWPDKNRQMSVKVAQKWFH